MAKSQSESSLRGAEGKRTMPGPGKKPIVFRHCEEFSDEAIPSPRAAWNEAGLKIGFTGKKQELKAGGVNSSFGTYREAFLVEKKPNEKSKLNKGGIND